MKINSKIIKPKLIKNNVFNFLTQNPSFNSDRFTFIPGFMDVHVHFREPGFSYKETILTGSKAAAHGGYTTVFTMPNLNPVSDTVQHILEQVKIIKSDAVINIFPYGSITIDQKGEKLSPLDETKDYVIAFSDDGKGVQCKDVMRNAMKKCRELNKVLVAHCEVNELLKGGYIHDGEYAKKHSHLGICSESEYLEIERDIELAKETGCKYHVCHVSTKESVELIRKAKKDGVDITCETAPHYLLLTDDDLKEDGSYKMNPPLRNKEDRDALIEGVKDGTIDIIATDHAPHSEDEKAKGLKDSPFGITGIEIAFPLLYTYLVKTKIITFDKLIDLIVINPHKRFDIAFDDSFSVWDLNEKQVINKEMFISKGKSTPFIGYDVFGVNHLTMLNGERVFENKELLLWQKERI